MAGELSVSSLLKEQDYIANVRSGCKKLPRGTLYPIGDFFRKFCAISNNRVIADIRWLPEFDKYQGWCWRPGSNNEKYFWGHPKDVAELKKKGALKCLKH